MRSRSITVKCMLNHKENEHFIKTVVISGLTKSELLRQLIMGTEIKARPPDQYIEIYRLVANMSNNINQIAHVANASQTVRQDQIQALLLMMDKCFVHIRDLR